MESDLTVRPITFAHVQLAKTEVAQSNVSSVVEQNVLWLQVAIDDVEAVQTLESTQQLRGVEASTIDVETLLLL